MNKTLSLAWRRAVTAATTGLLLAAGATAQTAAPAWLQPGFDAAQSWANPQERTLKPRNVGQLSQLWSQQLGQFYVGQTTQSEGVLYACSNLYGLSALDAASGATLWTRGGLGGNCGAATLTDSVAYVTTRPPVPSQSTLSALNRADGSTLWSVPVPNPQANSLGFQDPTLAGKRLYVADGRSGISAFDAATGALHWQAATGMLNNQAAVAGGMVYLSTWGNGGSEPHRVFAFSAKDGTPKWTKPTDLGNSQYPPAVAAGRVFAGSDSGTVYAYDAATGKPLWHTAFSGYVSAPLVAIEQALFVNTGTRTVSAIDARNGQVRWSTTLPNSAAVSSNLVLANGVLFFTITDFGGVHRLTTMDARTGQPGAILPEILWGSHAQVTVVEGRVHVSTSQGFLQVYGLK
ncbi:MAG TPA: PQQ-binding-like beta-propeller repeat protein [Ideonella sp.]|nr:PQQ-binding-like beta-propeller repeat protein [Ideonella sp.]